MSKRILLIDSDESFAQGLQQAVSARGLFATVATNSEQGMQLARADSPDLIVVCVEAQPTNGYMLCTRLKKDDALKAIPVVLTSAQATPDSFEKHKKLKTRAEEYLIKPFHPDELLQKISALLGVQLAAEQPAAEEEIVSMEDEPIGLGDLVGEDEPVHLSDSEAAEAHAAGSPLLSHADEVEVEEVVTVEEEPPAERSTEDELQMFDAAFDALSPAAAKSAPAAAEPDPSVFQDLHLAPSAAEQQAELADVPVTSEITPADEASYGAVHAGIDPDAHAALEARVAQLEGELAAKDAELESVRRSASASPASPAELLRLKEARTKGDKEILRLKQELNEKEKQLNEKESELIELREQQTTLESQAHQLKDDGAKRDAAAKALQQRAEALGAAAKKFERELVAAREELKTMPPLKVRIAELEAVERAHGELKRQHETVQADAESHRSRADGLDAELERHKGRASELETELSGARALHETEAEQLK
jgi:CheY-like chemotaxis protein